MAEYSLSFEEELSIPVDECSTLSSKQEENDLKNISNIIKIVPSAIGLISEPPSLTLLYSISSPGSKKPQKRKRKMPLAWFTDRTNVIQFTYGLKQRHDPYLQDVPNVVIEKLLKIIQLVQKGILLDNAIAQIKDEYSVKPDENLNAMSEEELAFKKRVMDESFFKRFIKPGDPDFVYDKRVEFKKDQNLSDNSWDSENETKDENNAPSLNFIKNLNKVPSNEPVIENLKMIDDKSDPNLLSNVPQSIQPLEHEEDEIPSSKNFGASDNDNNPVVQDLYSKSSEKENNPEPFQHWQPFKSKGPLDSYISPFEYPFNDSKEDEINESAQKDCLLEFTDLNLVPDEFNQTLDARLPETSLKEGSLRFDELSVSEPSENKHDVGVTSKKNSLECEESHVESERKYRVDKNENSDKVDDNNIDMSLEIETLENMLEDDDDNFFK